MGVVRSLLEKVFRGIRYELSCEEFVRSIQRYSIEMRAVRNFVRRIARYSIELGVVRRILGEM